MGTPEDEPRSDEEKAIEYLQGSLKEIAGAKGRKHVKHEYFKPGSEEERQSRAALVRLLRRDEPLSKNLRSVLAMLFDPEEKIERRMIAIVPRKIGRQADPAIAVEIARYIAEEEALARGKAKAISNAKADAVARYKVAPATVERAWNEWKELARESVRRELSNLPPILINE